MTDAELYRRTHALLHTAKLARWRIARTAADGFWRLTSPGGATVTVAGRPTMRALLAAEVSFYRIPEATLNRRHGAGLTEDRVMSTITNIDRDQLFADLAQDPERHRALTR